MREVISIHIGQAGVQVQIVVGFSEHFRWGMLVGNSTVSSTVSNLMERKRK